MISRCHNCSPTWCESPAMNTAKKLLAIRGNLEGSYTFVQSKCTRKAELSHANFQTDQLLLCFELPILQSLSFYKGPFLIRANYNKAVLEPRVSPAFTSTYFCNHCNIRFGGTRNSETSLNSHTRIWIQGRGVCEFRYPFVVLNFGTHWNNSAHNQIRSRILPYVC